MYHQIEQIMTYKIKNVRKWGLCLMPLLLLFLFWMVMRQPGFTYNREGLRSLAVPIAITLLYLVALPAGALRYRRRVRRQFAQFTREQLEEIDRLCEGVQPIEGIVVTDLALIGPETLIPLAQIVWVYHKETTQNGVATIQELVAVTCERKTHRIPLRVKPGPFREADPQTLLALYEQLRLRNKRILCGYSQKLARLPREKFAQLARWVCGG